MKMKSMKAMKVMKAKAMKVMKMKKAMKVSKIGKKWTVFKGFKLKTKGGLTLKDLKKNKSGKIVSKKASLAWGKSKAKKWAFAVVAARKALGFKGFVAIGGKTAKGAALYKK